VYDTRLGFAMLPPDALRELLNLLHHGDARDRAFVDAMVRIEWARTTDPHRRAIFGELHDDVRASSLRSHAGLRAEISAGLRGADLRRRFDDVPVLERDHFVEEVLGIAYPPLDEPILARELISYTPSGYDEIVYALDVTRLGAGDRFVDVGSGAGKAVMLAALLAGAASSGVECNRALSDLAADASQRLELGGVRFQHADARDAAIEDADVVFMYLPFTGETLATFLARLMERGRRPRSSSRDRFLCAAALDTSRYPNLAPVGLPKSWLQIYSWE
jgi:protein-L-isoaspartate O-methyltransferase